MNNSRHFYVIFTSWGQLINETTAFLVHIYNSIDTIFLHHLYRYMYINIL
jgi:hypothetical protein